MAYRMCSDGVIRRVRAFLPYLDTKLNIRYDRRDFVVTKRRAFCRGCGKDIPPDVKRLSKQVDHCYGRRGWFNTRFSYCLPCAKKLTDLEVRECQKHIAKITKLYKEVSLKDKRYSKKRLDEEELIKQI